MDIFIERRLRSTSRRLTQLRSDLAVAEEHLAHFVDDADDAQIRSLVSETPQASDEHTEASRHAARMRRHRDELRESIASLERQQDELLDRLSARNR